MLRRSIATVVTGLSIASCGTNHGETTTAFVGARIIDGTGAAPIENGVMVVRAGRIEAVGTAEFVAIPEGAKRIDVSGRTIIPGLINTHGHVGDVLGLEGGHYSEENILRRPDPRSRATLCSRPCSHRRHAGRGTNCR